MTSSEVSKKLELFEFAPGRKISWASLQNLLPNVEAALFFAKAYQLNYGQLGKLVSELFKSPLMDALFNEGGTHSVDLQDYLIDTVPADAWPVGGAVQFEADIPPVEFLAHLLEAAEIKIASSIQVVADKLAGVLDSLPSKEGRMVFDHLAQMNRRRPTIGRFQPKIKHQAVPNQLVILDVSQSVSQRTVEAIIADVVAMSWKANAYLAIVSNNTFVWEPGTYNVKDVLARAEFSGTHYETLASLFDRDWGTVITIADYDSSIAAAEHIRKCKGRIGLVLDVSLVNRPTYLAEVVGQLADEVEPMLIANSSRVL